MVNLNSTIENFKVADIDIGDGITVKPYLPYEDKVELVSGVIRNSMRTDDDTDLIIVSHAEEQFFCFHILMHYTNIETDMIDIVELYDYAKKSGQMKKIFDAVKDDIDECARMYIIMKESILKINQQALSISAKMKEMMEMTDTAEFEKLLTIAKVEGNKVADNMSALVNPKKGSMQMLNLAKK